MTEAELVLEFTFRDIECAMEDIVGMVRGGTLSGFRDQFMRRPLGNGKGASNIDRGSTACTRKSNLDRVGKWPFGHDAIIKYREGSIAGYWQKISK